MRVFLSTVFPFLLHFPSFIPNLSCAPLKISLSFYHPPLLDNAATTFNISSVVGGRTLQKSFVVTNFTYAVSSACMSMTVGTSAPFCSAATSCQIVGLETAWNNSVSLSHILGIMYQSVAFVNYTIVVTPGELR